MNLHLPENDDLKEIVFENRNKAYGAYRLRTDYHRNLNRAMGISLLAVSLFAGLSFIAQKVSRKPDTYIVDRKDPYIVRTIELEQSQVKTGIKSPDIPQVKAEKTPVLPKPLEQNFDVVKEVKPADARVTTTETPVSPVNGLEANPLASATTGTTTPGLPDMLPTDIPSGPVELAALDVAPVFPGGMDKFYKYLRKNLVFTTAAKEARLAGRMHVNFVLGPDGRITSVNILQKMGYGLDEVVESVLAKSPVWSPGKVRGQPVSTVIRLPINFTALQ